MQVGIDGINVDFEKISKDCGVHYIQFIRELSVKCRQNGIVLSVDNYVPKGYNQQYNRKEQGVMADYVIIMGYDEHNGSSLEAGSVSSYEFVKEGSTGRESDQWDSVLYKTVVGNAENTGRTESGGRNRSSRLSDEGDK